MSSIGSQDYVVMFHYLSAGAESSIHKQVIEKMNKLWYYHLTPADKSFLRHELGIDKND